MEEVAGIYAGPLPGLDRHVQIGVASGRLVHLSFPQTPDEGAGDEHELLERVLAHAAGEAEDDFGDVEVALTVPTDQRAVLEALRPVPPGESIDLETLVRTTPGLDPDEEASTATVREALAGNPVPLVIPDHRVDGAEGATPGPVRRHLREVEGLPG